MERDRNGYVSPLSTRYASKAMQYLFSENNKFRTWRRLWIALAPAERELRERFGPLVYGVDVPSLEAVCLTLLGEKALTLSAAESCTGGLLAKRVTDLPGASRVFKGGVVSYWSEVKAGVLGVPEDMLEEQGAVSAPVARAMARGVRALMGTDLAISVTGVAGPDRDERDNPVGLVYIGLAWEGGDYVREICKPGPRERIRRLAANHGFDLVRRKVLGLGLEL